MTSLSILGIGPRNIKRATEAGVGVLRRHVFRGHVLRGHVATHSLARPFTQLSTAFRRTALSGVRFANALAL